MEYNIFIILLNFYICYQYTERKNGEEIAQDIIEMLSWAIVSITTTSVILAMNYSKAGLLTTIIYNLPIGYAAIARWQTYRIQKTIRKWKKADGFKYTIKDFNNSDDDSDEL